MVIVKIIRDSIRKNPNAGRQTTLVPGCRSASFECKGKIPDHLLPLVVITEEAFDGSFTAGLIINPDDWMYLVKEPGIPPIDIKVDNNIVAINYLPESRYLYSYEDPALRCDECYAGVPVSDIDIDYTDDVFMFMTCPKCKGINTFPDFKFEDIFNALKDINL